MALPFVGSWWRPIFDAWTSLDYKSALWGSRVGGVSWMAPTWVGGHSRRLQAYKVLQSYVDNASRYFLDLMPDGKGGYSDSMLQEMSHREYGDANLLVNVILAALIGDSQEIHVDGADDYDENAPDADDNAPAGSGVAQETTADYKPRKDPRSEPNTPEAKAAFDLQERLREWAKDEQLGMKLIECERDAVALGDGVYALGWDDRKERPRLKVWDPGFYFPVFDDFMDDDEFPRRVHIAYEQQDEYENNKKTVRRITYDLREVNPDRGEAPLNVPWADQPSNVQCYMTDGLWSVDAQNVRIDDFGVADQYATMTVNGEAVVVRDLPLGIDFIPVVHMPNTVAVKNHFGRSSIAPVLQVLDDIQAADSDLQSAMSLTGSPMLAFSGTRAPDDIQVGPGKGLNLGENGSVNVIEASAGLKEMRDSIEGLIKRLMVNSRVPDAVVGRVDAHRVTAGIVLTLSFGPLITLVKELRLVRDEKYAILLRFVQRFYQANGMLPAGDLPEANVVFGSYLPSDQGAVAAQAVSMYQAKVASLNTVVRMLVEAGFPIEDIAQEVEDINSHDFAAAVQLLDATGDEAAVGEFLNIAITPRTPPPMNLNVPGRPPGAGNGPAEQQPPRRDQPQPDQGPPASQR